MIYGLILLYAAVLALAGVSFALRRRDREALRELRGRYEALADALERVHAESQSFYKSQGERMNIMTGCMDDLKNGIVPDYEKAKAATRAMNDFNTGIAQIMGYDPMAVIKRERSKGGGE